MTLTVDNIIFAALLAFAVTWVLNRAYKMFYFIKSGNGIGLKYSNTKNIARMLSQCHSMFPFEIIRFNGEVFKRGMSVRITTTQHKTFEGKIIGLNHDNILCMITKTRIIAHELEEIEDIITIEASEI